MENVKDVEFGKNITIKGTDLQKGLWPALNKLSSDASLELGTKTRVAAIFRDLQKQTNEFQKEYDAKVNALNWEGEGQNRKCVEPEKLDEINKSFEQKAFIIIGRKIKAKSLERAQLSAKDLLALEPMIEDLF